MAYDEKMAERIAALLRGEQGISHKEMFGGIAFLVDGKMFAGLANENLMVRVGKERHVELSKKPGAKPMDFTGRPMKGYLYVAPSALKTEKALAEWVELSLAHTRTLEKKPAKKKATRRKAA